MNTALEDQTAAHEERWRAWVEKGRQRDRAAVLKYKWLGGVAVGIVVIAAAFYLGAIR